MTVVILDISGLEPSGLAPAPNDEDATGLGAGQAAALEEYPTEEFGHRLRFRVLDELEKLPEHVHRWVLSANNPS